MKLVCLKVTTIAAANMIKICTHTVLQLAPDALLLSPQCTDSCSSRPAEGGCPPRRSGSRAKAIWRHATLMCLNNGKHHPDSMEYPQNGHQRAPPREVTRQSATGACHAHPVLTATVACTMEQQQGRE